MTDEEKTQWERARWLALADDQFAARTDAERWAVVERAEALTGQALATGIDPMYFKAIHSVLTRYLHRK